MTIQQPPETLIENSRAACARRAAGPQPAPGKPRPCMAVRSASTGDGVRCRADLPDHILSAARHGRRRQAVRAGSSRTSLHARLQSDAGCLRAAVGPSSKAGRSACLVLRAGSLGLRHSQCRPGRVTTSFRLPDFMAAPGRCLPPRMKNFGIETRFVDAADPEAFARATDDRTRAYYAESLPIPSSRSSRSPKWPRSASGSASR